MQAVPAGQLTSQEVLPTSSMARAGKTFHLASRLLPKRVRDRVVELYSFCREVDDLADAYQLPVAERRLRLEEVRRDLAAGICGGVRGNWTLIFAAGQQIVTLAAAELVRAAEGDLEQRQPKTEQDLLRYAFGVAGTVGLMLCEILGACRTGQATAIHLGIAMQLTNIARDVAEDARAGRVYLPLQWIGEHEVTLALNGSPAARNVLRASTDRLLQTAELFYESAYTGMAYLPLRVRWSILAAAFCYREIGVRVARDPERSWTERTVVGMGRKLALVAKAGLLVLTPMYREVPDAIAQAKTKVLCVPICDELIQMGISW